MPRWDAPYHGAPVERVTTASGAIASRALVDHRRVLEPQVLPICDGVWSVIGLSVANAHAIAGERVDSGSSEAEGIAIRRLLR